MPMTPKQSEVLDQVFDLMHEHFDCFALVFDTADAEDERLHITDGQFSGGDAAAVGMLRIFATKLEARHIRPDRRDDLPPKV